MLRSVITDFKKIILRRYLDLLGWHTKNQYVVFESDDWGAIRMPSMEILLKLDKMGFQASSNKYEANDSIESNEDVQRLFNVLQKYRDHTGNHPIFTLNFVMANPDFEKIKESNYHQYYYEHISETYKRYNGNNSILDLYRQGIEETMICPQFHSREHFNVALWMEALQCNMYKMRELAEMGCVATNIPSRGGNIFVRSYDVRNVKERTYIKESIKEGLSLYNSIFGKECKTAIAPCYLWDVDLEPTYDSCGIRMLQGGYIQHQSLLNHRKKSYNSLGKVRNNIILSVRNCMFEPVYFGDQAITNCLDDIEKAFRHQKPAIVCSHRVNYIGRITQNNATANLNRLSLLLDAIIKKYPEVNFISSERLLEVIINDSLYA